MEKTTGTMFNDTNGTMYASVVQNDSGINNLYIRTNTGSILYVVEQKDIEFLYDYLKQILGH